MSHEHHEGFPSYHPDQILYDGCHECASRACSQDCGIGSLDTARFLKAWARAQEWEAFGLNNDSITELPLLNVLSSVRAQLTAAHLLADTP